MPLREFVRRVSPRGMRQDADNAMRGDVVRGLVEIITNADDAYVRAGHSGPIRITVEHLDQNNGLSARVSVADCATGMTADEMEEKFGVAGARHSGFEKGVSVRGLMGRGFGDVAELGETQLESIKDGDWATVTLKDPVNGTIADEPTEAIEEIRKRLRLDKDESGSTVTINVRHPISVSRDLAARISNHTELRKIINEREVTFEATGGKVESLRRLVYEPPRSAEVVRKDVVVPGYPEASAELVVYEMEEPQTGRVGPESHHGLLIEGSRAGYGNYLFDLERKPGAGYLRGSFSCPYIDHLIRDFDDRDSRGEERTFENPFRLVSRSRDGLQNEHPFVKALAALFTEELLPLIEELERKRSGDKGPGEPMQKRFDALARELAKMLSDDLAELDEDERSGDGLDEAPLKVIPARVRLQPGERKTLTVHVRQDLMGESWDGGLTAVSDATTIVALDGKPDPLEPHTENPQVMVSRVRVTAGSVDGNALIRLKTGDEENACLVTVDSEVPLPDPQPEDLEFTLSRISMRIGRPRRVEIRAPLDLVTGEGTEVTVGLDGDRTIKLLTETCRLRLTQDGWYSGRIRLVGDAVGATGQLTAELGDRQATIPVVIVDPKDPEGLDLKIEWLDRRVGDFRASLEPNPNGHLLKIYGRHKAIAPLLGSWDNERQAFRNVETREVSLVLAEILATEMTHYLIEREFNRPSEQFDAPSYAAKYRKRLGKYLGLAQRMLWTADS